MIRDKIKLYKAIVAEMRAALDNYFKGWMEKPDDTDSSSS